MQLKLAHKTWLYANLKKFFTNDQYFKYIDINFLLPTISYHLKKSKSSNELLINLPSEFHTPVKFHRKEHFKFIYPSIKTQIDSLLNCWEEILEIKKIQNKSILSSTLIDEAISEVEEVEEEEVEEEVETNEGSYSQTFINFKLRNCFGQGTNTLSHYENEENVTLKKKILSNISSIKRSYQSEYSDFKKKIIYECNEAAERNNHVTLLQTDIKTFYHSIDTDSLIKHLNNNYSSNCKNIVRILQNIQDETSTKELPIGWILSGPIIDIILCDIAENLKGNECKYINYVDDYIILFEHERSTDKEICDSTVDLGFNILKEEFDKVFGKGKIKFHENGDKLKRWHLDSRSLSVIDMNWFDMQSNSIMDEDEFKWSGIQEFMLPADNDLTINEKVQFFENLRQIREKAVNFDFNSWENFDNYFNKIIYKISLSFNKYIGTITEIIFITGNSLESSNLEIIQRLDNLFNVLNENSQSANTWLSLLKQTSLNNNSRDISNWIIKKSTYLAKHFKERDCEEDAILIQSWLRIFLLKNDLNAKIKTKNKEAFNFLSAELNRVDVIAKAIYDTKKTSDKTFENNEFTLCLAMQIKKKANLIDRFLKLYQLIDHEVFSEVLCEGLHFHSHQITDEDIVQLMSLDINLQAKNFLTSLIDSYSYAHKYLYELHPVEQIKEYNQFIEDLNAGKRFKKASFIEYIRSKEKQLARKEITAILLHLSSNTDHWKKIYLLIPTTFYFSNYISPSLFPTVYNEIGLSFFSKIKKLLEIKTKHLSIVKTNQQIKKKVKKTSLLNELNSLKNKSKVLSLNADILLTKDQKFTGDMKEEVKITIASIGFDIDKDYTPANNFGHSYKTKKEIITNIYNALEHAKKSSADFIVFPELCIPRDELKKVLNKAGKYKIILIGGLEGASDTSKKYRNTTVISFPVKKSSNFVPNYYTAFFQYKNYPAASELFALDSKKHQYINGKCVYLIKTNKFGNFSILTCSDFLSSNLKKELKGKIQTLFTPAVNHDNSTYNIAAEACVRDLYCNSIICNNSHKGSSTVIAPYSRPYQRNIFTTNGKTSPSFATISINLRNISDLQKMTPHEIEKERHKKRTKKQKKNDRIYHLVTDYKQLPPDWEDFMPVKK